jgi:hypothetical protein
MKDKNRLYGPARRKRAYLKQSRAVIPAASAEDAKQLLQSTPADSIRTRYVSLSTFLFRFFQTSSGDPHQFLVGQVINVVVLPRVVGLGACYQSDPLVCLLSKAKIDSKGLSTSGHRLLHQLLDYNFMLRDTFPSSVLIDGHDGFGFSDQFMVDV